MAANSKKNIAIGTQWGEGQVSLDTLLSISASSITQPAEAGSNVEAENIPLSMTGATGVPAPESAVSQIQLPGMIDGRKGTGKMTPESQNGGDPPVVGRKPTGSDSAAPLFLTHRHSESDVLETVSGLFGFDQPDPDDVDFGGECTIDIGGCYLADGPRFQVWYRHQIWIDVDHNPLKVEPEVVGNVLANYEYGGIDAVEAYLESLECNDSDEEPEGSQSLPANSPEHLKVNSQTENGDEVD